MTSRIAWRFLRVLSSVSLLVISALASAVAETLPTSASRSASRRLTVMRGEHAAMLWWEAHPDAVWYSVYRRVDDNPEADITPRLLTDSSFVDVDAPSAGELAYRVVAHLSDGGDLEYDTAIATRVSVARGRPISGQSIASDHSKDNIIDDSEFTASISLAAVRNFLAAQNSFLAGSIVDYGGATIDPASVIHNAAAQYAISANVILTMLQKEQGLVTIRPASAPAPNDWSIKCAMGYGCEFSNYLGFANQVNSAAAGIRRYLSDLATNGQTQSGWRIGVAKATRDCMTVTPANAATAALYTYNPLVGAGWGGCTTYGANWAFWDIFYNRFGFGSSGGGSGSSTELIQNGGFESGATSWTRSGSFYASTSGSYPRAGSGYAYLSNADLTPGNNLSGTLYQAVSIPASAISARLSFWYSITTQETTANAYDTLTVTVRDTSNTVLATVTSLSNLNKTSSASTYNTVTFDAGAYTGRTVRVYFSGQTDASYPTVFRVDDVSLQVTLSTTTNHALSVSSQNPSAGVLIGVSPVDGNGAGDGTTPFTRSYASSTPVYVVAPSSFGPNSFSQWLRDGTVYSLSNTTTVVMDAAHTMTAVYVACPTPAIPAISAPSAATNGNAYTVSWSATSPDSLYDVQESTDSTFGTALTFPVIGTSRAFTQSVASTTMFYYRVRARASCGSASNYSWYATTTVSPPTGATRHPKGDVSGDGMADLIWRNGLSGSNALWLINGNSIGSGAALATVPDTNFFVAGIGDFDGEGKADLLWRNGVSGANVIWFMNGASITSTAMLPAVADPAWTIAGVGDFQGDGKEDILWRNVSIGANAMWLMNGSAIQMSDALPAVPDTVWQIVGIGDFQGDGKDDILWRHAASGANAIWLMNGISIAVSASLPMVGDTNWRVAGVGDFQGDGKADLFWRNSFSGDDVLWFMDGSNVASTAVLSPVRNLNWTIVRVSDFQGDGKSDVFWRNTATGANVQWLMDGSTIAVATPFATVSDPAWQIVNR